MPGFSFFSVLLQLFSGLLIFHVEFICHIQGGKWFQPRYQKGIVKCKWLRTRGLYLLQAEYKEFFLPLFFLNLCVILKSPCGDRPMYRKRRVFSSLVLCCYSELIRAEESSVVQVDFEDEINTALNVF